ALASPEARRLERVDHVSAERILTSPGPLQTGYRVYEVVVRKGLRVGIVMPVFQASEQTRDLGNVVGDSLCQLPQGLGSPVGSRPVHIVEKLSTRCEFPVGPVVDEVSRRSLPACAVPIDDRTAFAGIQILRRQGHASKKGGFPREYRINCAQVGVRMARKIWAPDTVEQQSERFVEGIQGDFTLVVGPAIVECRGVVPSVVHATGKRNIVVEHVVAAKSGVSQRLAVVENETASFIVVLVRVGRDDLGTEQCYEASTLNVE